ncbi:hypothetical protein LX66_0252 [Chitinophaga japonensis]|uniref:Uncharacterized protein n=1 Tax=Chitinophaga japonensis TaxID=104662 RepID=A0A562TBH0_CHIJA|nr:hypothetical protein LX66_0252 [Chitinophaga japonensis]
MRLLTGAKKVSDFFHSGFAGCFRCSSFGEVKNNKFRNTRIT